SHLQMLRASELIAGAIGSGNLLRLPELQEIAAKEDPERWISKRLKTEQVGNSEDFEISFAARNPETANGVLTAAMEAHLSSQAESSEVVRQSLHRALNDELQRLDYDLRLKRETLIELSKQGGGDTPAAAGNVGANFDMHRALISNLQHKVVDAEVEIEL